MKLSRYVFVLILMVSICSCTTTTPPKEVAEPEPSYALEPGKDGAFADLEAAFIEQIIGSPSWGVVISAMNISG
jgi:hypothetical protein